MNWLLTEIRALGVEVDLGQTWQPRGEDVTIDCRGIGSKANLPSLRGVGGDGILIQSRDVTLSRPRRGLHPRQPIYVVPHSEGRFVVGASVIEREDDGPITLKSALDLLGSAYALHPAFGEALIWDIVAGIRPSFPDNVPRIIVEDDGRMIRVNGAYRHGFLLAPVLAKAVVTYVSDGGIESPLCGHAGRDSALVRHPLFCHFERRHVVRLARAEQWNFADDKNVGGNHQLGRTFAPRKLHEGFARAIGVCRQ